jgi:SAM-dependent MidA family methyltransferase
VASDGLPDELAGALEEAGSLRFDRFVELALYGPSSGFFATSGRAGRRGGDFITSPEVGPLFGAVLARRLDRLWDDLGRPDPFTVVEAGAGRGALALAVRAAAPRCLPTLCWHLVERSASLRAAQHEHLPIGEPWPGPGGGPVFASSASLAEVARAGQPAPAAVVANELLDNLPSRLMARGARGWSEVHVRRGPGPGGGGAALVEELVDAPAGVAAELARLAPHAAAGVRAPWQERAAAWVRDARDLLSAGLVLAFDYTDTTASMAARPQAEWLRTYRSHGRGGHHLEAPGTQDITVEVALDQLPPPSAAATQAEWLRGAGIEDLVDAARRRWAERAGIGDLEAVRARSVPLEAEALCDPAGLGAFTALEWHVG